MDLDSRILKRLVGMVLAPQAINGRVNLDGIDVLSSPLQSPANVIAGTGSDDQHVRESRSAGVAIQQVWQRIGRKVLVSRNHLLVIDQVDRKRQVCLLKINSVIRRPELLCFTLALIVMMRGYE